MFAKTLSLTSLSLSQRRRRLTGDMVDRCFGLIERIESDTKISTYSVQRKEK